jgi:hypothetical protein
MHRRVASAYQTGEKGGAAGGPGLPTVSARISANAGVVQQRRRWWLRAKSLKINKRCNAGVARSGLQNRGLQVRVLPGLFAA